jgi:uncharacterized membrane protein
MLQNFSNTLTFALALGSGLVAGIFFAFSSFVMSALGRLPPEQGIAAMQSINITVLNPVFFAAFLGTAAGCVLLGAGALWQWDGARTAIILVGCTLYVLGCFGVTIGGNVPLNDALAAVDPNSTEGARLWAGYLVDWTRWNHVRTAASLAAAGAFTFVLR